jgi:hypothetical protein
VSPFLLAGLREVLGRDRFGRSVSEAEADAYVELIPAMAPAEFLETLADR